MAKFGIDVSHHNGKIDWNKVKSQIDFAILKLGNIGDGNKFWIDSTFETNYNECKRLNIPIGVYVYSYTNQISNIEECAKQTLKYLDNRKLQLPVYIDMEDKEISVEGKARLTEMVFKYNEIIEKGGYWAGVYANRNWFDNYLDKNKIKARFTTWIATYVNAVDKYKGEYDIWQNSEKGKISGIVGNVDTNYMYRDLMSEIGNTKATGTTQKTMSIVDLAYEVLAGKHGIGEARKKSLGSLYNDVQAKVNEILKNRKSVKEIAKEVKDGKWGNGETRKKKLEQAGYNYQEIQDIVNKLSK